MNGKGNYRNVKIKIDNYIKEYAATAGEPTAVIYFVDVDSDSYQGDQKQLNKDIKKFCSDNGYEIVWFKKDVEHVMLGEQVSDDLKTQKARSFFAQKKIYKVDENLLNRDSKNLKDKESNVLKVLDYYLERRWNGIIIQW